MSSAAIAPPLSATLLRKLHESNVTYELLTYAAPPESAPLATKSHDSNTKSPSSPPASVTTPRATKPRLVFSLKITSSQCTTPLNEPKAAAAKQSCIEIEPPVISKVESTSETPPE